MLLPITVAVLYLLGSLEVSQEVLGLILQTLNQVLFTPKDRCKCGFNRISSFLEFLGQSVVKRV